MYDFLKKIPLFGDLSEEDLEHLCELVDELDLPKGQLLFSEGSEGDQAYVIQSGELEITKFSQGQEVLLAVRGEGEVIGEMALLQQAPRMASVRGHSDAHLIVIGFEQFHNLLNNSTTAARTMLQTVTSRWRVTQAMLRQSEKMAQLGNLAAGMAHELNNPAAAALRGVETLREAAEKLQETNIQLNKLGIEDKQIDFLISFNEYIESKSVSPLDLDPLSRSDQEYVVETWLEEHGVESAWLYAPNLVGLSMGINELDEFSSNFMETLLPTVLSWVNETHNIHSLLYEVAEGAKRISEIVNALKSYSFLDQAPTQSVNIHEGLDTTLVLLRNKLKKGVHVQREYDKSLPEINAYGSELNQVWTNLIDNAVDAMDGSGEIIIRTHKDGEWIVIEIEDNGPGIPQKIQDNIFDAYFTTKPPGKGTGLGLDISKNIVTGKHRGEISVSSEPGRTTFKIKLPLNFEAVR